MIGPFNMQLDFYSVEALTFYSMQTYNLHHHRQSHEMTTSIRRPFEYQDPINLIVLFNSFINHLMKSQVLTVSLKYRFYGINSQYLINFNIMISRSFLRRGGTRSRARSRSLGRQERVRHYSPDGRAKSRYFVREYGDFDSESAESEVEEELPRRRQGS